MNAFHDLRAEEWQVLGVVVVVLVVGTVTLNAVVGGKGERSIRCEDECNDVREEMHFEL